MERPRGMQRIAGDRTTAAATAAAIDLSWKGTGALRRVHALNERCLEVLAQIAGAERDPVTEIVLQHRNLWRAMNPTALKRAALTPFLLVDVHFQSDEWWRWAREPRSTRRRGGASRTSFPTRSANELMRETLMLAWSTAGSDREAASLLMGMTPRVSSIIAELGPQDVERIAARHSRHLRLRWEDLPQFWGRLLRAAHDADEESLYELHLHGIQLLGSELIPLLDAGSGR